MEQLTFKLEAFEGPLDLLLHLVAKNKMNIYEIEILSLIDQYIELIEHISRHQMEVASEFIEMAAHLVQMKSYLLLPKSEEAERMKQELTGLLVEYSLCKKVAERLRTMAEEVYFAVREPQALQQQMDYTLRHEAYVLKEAYLSLAQKGAVRRAPVREQFEPLTTAPFVSVGSRIVHVLRGLITGKLHSLSQLFMSKDSKSTVVATFLAVLELVRSGRIEIEANRRLKMKR